MVTHPAEITYTRGTLLQTRMMGAQTAKMSFLTRRRLTQMTDNESHFSQRPTLYP